MKEGGGGRETRENKKWEWEWKWRRCCLPAWPGYVRIIVAGEMGKRITHVVGQAEACPPHRTDEKEKQAGRQGGVAEARRRVAAFHK